jgi:hypothetical protein
LGSLADLQIGSSGTDTATYEYQDSDYGDTRVVMVVMSDLAYEDIGEQGSPSIRQQVNAGIAAAELAVGQAFPLTLPPISPGGTNDGIDLNDLSGLLRDYPGLEFQTVPAYLYINGPERIFQGGNVSYTLNFEDGSHTLASFTNTVVPLALPGLPASVPLSPRPEPFDMAFVFNNAPPNLKATIAFAVGEITINSLEELRAFAADLQTPLTANLVLLLPFRFTVNNEKAPRGIPVFAGPELDPAAPADSPPNPAIGLIENGGDLLGRDGSGEGAMEDIMENLQSLVMEASIVNNLGINGYIKMLPAMPESYDPNAGELGRIKLSGTSSISIPKDKLETLPFSPALEIYLDGAFDIKRDLPPEGAMTMNMAIILRTTIDVTF